MRYAPYLLCYHLQSVRILHNHLLSVVVTLYQPDSGFLFYYQNLPVCDACHDFVVICINSHLLLGLLQYICKSNNGLSLHLTFLAPYLLLRGELRSRSISAISFIFSSVSLDNLLSCFGYSLRTTLRSCARCAL